MSNENATQAPEIRVWHWDDCAYWAGYTFAETLAAAREQDGPGCYEDAAESDEITPAGLHRIHVRVSEDGAPLQTQSMAELLAESIAAGEQFPRVMAYEDC
jgi:hypothetical protein